MNVQEMALAALSDKRAAEAADRAERDRRRAEDEAEKDAKAMQLVPRSPLVEWFPGAVWNVVARMPQDCVIVASEGQPDDVPLFFLSYNGNAVSVSTLWANERGGFGGHFTMPKPAFSPADVGQAVEDARRAIDLAADAPAVYPDRAGEDK